MDLGRRMQPSVRPKKDRVGFMCGVCGEEGVDGLDSDADDEAEEGTKAKGVEDVCVPSQTEIDEHNLAHVPFRDCCPYCVRGKGVSSGHKLRG